MAPTPSEARDVLVGLSALAVADLSALFAKLEGATADQVRDALIEALPGIGDTYGLAAGSLAAYWYEDLRERSEVPGSFSAEPAEAVDPARWESLARWGVSPLYGPVADAGAALTLLSGGMQRTVTDHHRLTVVDNSIRDPRSSGWKRIGVGDNCGFCRMLIGRGAVYTDATVTFRSHDWCNCAASPTWALNVVKISREPYRQSQRNRSDETKARDNERAREYIADNYGGPRGASTGRKSGTPTAKTDLSFAGMARAQIEKQIEITERLKDSPWRMQQLARLRKRLAEIS